MWLNSLSADGRRRNQRIRRDWPWHVAGLEALAAHKSVTCRIHGTMTILAHPHDAAGKTIFLTGGYEPPESAFIKRYVHAGMVAFDIGANIGAHTLLLAQCVGEGGRVHAFEPSAAVELLHRSVLANHLGQVTVNPIALGSVSGSLRLVRCTPGNEAFTSIGTPLYAAAAAGYVDVSAQTLDEYVAKTGLTHVDFAKMDVEGAEILVLQGARNVLASRSVSAWLFEMNDVCLRNAGCSPAELERMFTDAGYTLFLLDDEGWPIPFRGDQVRKNRDNVALLPWTLERMTRGDGTWGDQFRTAFTRAAMAP